MMNNQDVANQLRITRQAVHLSLSRSVPKLYKNFREKYNTSPYETFTYLVTGLEIKSQGDISHFFEYLTEEDQNEIKIEAIEKFPNVQKCVINR